MTEKIVEKRLSEIAGMITRREGWDTKVSGSRIIVEDSWDLACLENYRSEWYGRPAHTVRNFWEALKIQSRDIEREFGLKCVRSKLEMTDNNPSSLFGFSSSEFVIDDLEANQK